jgi:chromosome segregation ATPase
MKEKVEEGADPAKQSIEELQRRYRELDRRKTQAETNLENANRRLNELKAEAREKYGTDDVAALRQKLKAMTDENEEKRNRYQAELDRIEKDLDAVEKNFAASEDSPTGDEEGL